MHASQLQSDRGHHSGFITISLQEEQPKKARKVEGSKDDIFGLGQPASRRSELLQSSLAQCPRTLYASVVTQRLLWSHATSRCHREGCYVLSMPGFRYDPEGLPVYSPEELNVGAGGETDQCPFDCTCCF